MQCLVRIKLSILLINDIVNLWHFYDRWSQAMINTLWKRSKYNGCITKNRVDYVMPKIVGSCILFWKRNLDSRNKSCIMIVTEPTTPLIFHAQPGGTFLFMGCFMYQYPKQILTIAQQIQSYMDYIKSYWQWNIWDRQMKCGQGL